MKIHAEHFKGEFSVSTTNWGPQGLCWQGKGDMGRGCQCGQGKPREGRGGSFSGWACCRRERPQQLSP